MNQIDDLGADVIDMEEPRIVEPLIARLAAGNLDEAIPHRISWCDAMPIDGRVLAPDPRSDRLLKVFGAKSGLSERHVCRIVDQPRRTQRRRPPVPQTSIVQLVQLDRRAPMQRRWPSRHVAAGQGSSDIRISPALAGVLDPILRAAWSPSFDL